MATKFASADLKIKMPDGAEFTFWFDGNGKITVDSAFDNPKPNAFSLVQVEDCPFATPVCKSACYVHNLEKAEREIHEKYRVNSKAMRAILANLDYYIETKRRFVEWISENCKTGFRWHVSGDIISLDHAVFIASISKMVPRVNFWIYTRSFPFLGPLEGIENLVVNLSADSDNWEQALAAHNKFCFRICYMTVDGKVPEALPEGSVIFPDYNLRGRNLLVKTDSPWWRSLNPEQRRMVCPPDFFGQSEHLRCGPCKKCLAHSPHEEALRYRS